MSDIKVLDEMSRLSVLQIKLVRRHAVQMLYQLDHQMGTALASGALRESALSDDALALFCSQNDVSVDLEPWLRRLLLLSLSEWEQHDRWLAATSTNWNLSRIGRIERSVLRVCLAELCHRSSVSAATVIADAAEIAKEFGSERSFAFVHGILDAIYKGHIVGENSTKGHNET